MAWLFGASCQRSHPKPFSFFPLTFHLFHSCCTFGSAAFLMAVSTHSTPPPFIFRNPNCWVGVCYASQWRHKKKERKKGKTWKFELVGFQSASSYMLQKSRFRINNWNLTRDLLTRSSHIQTLTPRPELLANSLCWDYSGVGSRRIVYIFGTRRPANTACVERAPLTQRCKRLQALHVSDATRKQWFTITQVLERSPATQTARPPKLLC